MARPKKHENGTEQITCRVPTELKQKVFREIEARPGISISDVVIEALELHGTKTLVLPEILQRRADAQAAQLNMTWPEFVEECIRIRLDGVPAVFTERQVRGVVVEPIQPKAVQAAAMAEAPFGKSVTEFLESRPVAAAEVPTLEPEPERRSWQEVFDRAKKEGDFGDEYFGEQIAAAGIARFPQGFKTWPQPKQVAWLDEKHPRKAE